MANNKFKIALLGNPNIGKTTLFNSLCGLNQKTGNYPGVTVDQTKGEYIYLDTSIEVIDLPGINSIYPQSADEMVVHDFLTNKDKSLLPDRIVLVVSALNLKRNLYLFHQVKDLGLPIVLAVNMNDVAVKRGVIIDQEKLAKFCNCEVVLISAKKSLGIDELKAKITLDQSITECIITDFTVDIEADVLLNYSIENKFETPYHAFLNLIYNSKKELIQQLTNNGKTGHQLRVNESILRYKKINSYLPEVEKTDLSKASDLTTKLDKWLLHPVWGYLTFLLIMFIVFQSIFSLASIPMDWIDAGTGWVTEYLNGVLPTGILSDLITNGLLPGIGGVLIFIPQIAILFFFFSILEETGYMTRIVFLMDKIMQRFGMSGKSVVPLISGLACSIPSIMAARTIENRKERLITILVAPLLTCSARIPVYVILISLIVPDTFYGPFGLQGIVMLGMYLVGIVSALLSAWVFKLILKNKNKSMLILEMPRYLFPSAKNIGINVWKNSWSFISNAGKIIIATSIILFVLATNGGDKFQNAEEIVKVENELLSPLEFKTHVANYELEHSYLGSIGKSIEPVIMPLGYDWKIGIALISSLAAREVFISTLKVIYSIGSDDTEATKEQMRKEINSNTGMATFNFATTISLLLFYAFALQCFSTIAVTYKETKSIKWTSIQFIYMGVFAYLASFIAYQLLA